MFKRSLLMVLLALSLVAVFAAEAPALLRGGTGGSGSTCDCIVGNLIPQCTLCGKCVEGTVRATGLGNVENTPTFVMMRVCVGGSFTIESGAAVCGSGEPAAWAVVCGNPGQNEWTAPGIQLGYTSGTFLGLETVLPGEVSKNGSAFVTVTGEPTGILPLLNSACPNPNWIAKDALPIDNTDAYFEEIILIEEVCYIRSALLYNDCYITGGVDSIEWDSVAQDFKPAPYTCPAPTTFNYSKEPILYYSLYGETCPPGVITSP